MFGITKRKHDLVALRIEDLKEHELPPVGFVQFADPETGQKKYIDTGNFSTRLAYKKWWMENIDRLKNVCVKTGTDMAVIQTGQDYVKPLLKLFRQREKRM